MTDCSQEAGILCQNSLFQADIFEFLLFKTLSNKFFKVVFNNLTWNIIIIHDNKNGKKTVKRNLYENAVSFKKICSNLADSRHFLQVSYNCRQFANSNMYEGFSDRSILNLNFLYERILSIQVFIYYYQDNGIQGD